MRFTAVIAIAAGLILVTDPASPRMAGCVPPEKVRQASAAASARWPQLILWAWERPEDLSFLDVRQVGVAYLVRTLRLKGDAVLVQPNLNGLKVPAGTWVMACARIETDIGHPPRLSPAQADQAVSALASLAEFPNAKAVQIDFDATASQRGFYRDLLGQLRRRLPPALPLSITALTSWCVGDDWISQLPVNEAVPMLFRMGPDRNSILLRLEAGQDFEEPLCRQSAGISVDEVLPPLPVGRRLYVFNPNGWTQHSLAAIIGGGKH